MLIERPDEKLGAFRLPFHGVGMGSGQGVEITAVFLDDRDPTARHVAAPTMAPLTVSSRVEPLCPSRVVVLRSGEAASPGQRLGWYGKPIVVSDELDTGALIALAG